MRMPPNPTSPLPTTTDEGDGLVREAVEHLRQRLAWQAVGVRLLWLLAIAALVPLVVVVADHLARGGLPRLILTTGLATWLAGVVVGVIGLVVAGWTLRLSVIFVARELERLAGIRHNVVLNALLLRRVRPWTYAADVAARQAATAVTTQPPPDTIDLRPARAAGLTLLAVLGVWGGYMLLGPKPVWPSLLRFLGMDLPAPTATRLELVSPASGDGPHVGESLEVLLAVHGRAVAEVHFDLLDPGQPEAKPIVTYTATESVGEDLDLRRFTLAPFEVQDDIHFRARAGDAALTGVIPVAPLPAVEKLEVWVAPPAYTGWSRYRSDALDLDVLAGSRATFTVWANCEVRDAIFVLTGERESRARMTVDAEQPKRAEVERLLTAGGTYRFEFRDPWGYAPHKLPEHELAVWEDQPPELEIAAPPPSEGTPTDLVNVASDPLIELVGADDVGVTKLEAVFPEPRGANARREALELPVEADPRDFRLRLPVSDWVTPGAPPVAVRFEASDNRHKLDGSAAPQVATTRTVLLFHPAVDPRGGEDRGGAGRQPQRRVAGDDPVDDGSFVEPDVAQGEGEASGEGEAEEPAENPEGEPNASARGSDDGDAEAQPREGGQPSDAGEVQPDEQGDQSVEGGAPRESEEGETDPREEAEEVVEKYGDKAREFVEEIKKENEDGDDPPPNEAEESGPDGEPREGETPPGAERSQPATDAPPEGQRPDQPPPPEPAAAGDPPKPGQPGEQQGPGTGDQPQEGQPNPGEQANNPGGEQNEDSPGRRPEEPGANPPENPTPGDEPEGIGRGPEGEAGESDQPKKEPKPGQGSAPTSGEVEGDAPRPAGQEPEEVPEPSTPEPREDDPNAAAPGPGGENEEIPDPQAGTDVEGEEEEREAAGDGFVPPSGERGPPLDSTGAAETRDGEQLLEWLARGGEVREEELVDAGWAPQQAAGFVEELERLREIAREWEGARNARLIRHDTRVASDGLRRGGQRDADVDTTAGAQDPVESRTRRIAPPRGQQIEEDLRALLDAYYKAMAGENGE